MNFNDVLELIGVTYELDSINQETEIETPRTVFCDKRSVQQSEFFEAGKQGIKPRYKFVINALDYNEEEKLRYRGNTFTIYRNYEFDEYIELYVEGRSDE